MTQAPQPPSTSAPASSSPTYHQPAPPWLNDPTEVLARTMWGENRGGGYKGMQSVGNVVMNRVNHPSWWGKTILTVCLKPWQFSTWNPLITGAPIDANYEATVAVTLSDPEFQTAMTIARALIGLKLPDITGGADSYYDKRIPEPKWVPQAHYLVEIAGQKFYRVV